MCEVPSEVQQSKVTRQLPLHSNLHKAKADSTGSLDFAIWLGPTIAALGRMDEGVYLVLPMCPLPPTYVLLVLFGTQPKVTLVQVAAGHQSLWHGRYGGVLAGTVDMSVVPRLASTRREANACGRTT